MPAILTQKYKTFLAQRLMTCFQQENSIPYLLVGAVLPWTDAANVTVNDSNPPIPTDDFQDDDFSYWRESIGAKRVQVTDIQWVAPRIDWATASNYAQYDDLDGSLIGKPFYVMDTSDVPFKVYKCLWNNHGAKSTTPPSTIGTAPTPQVTTDGYVWQYMYTLDEENALKFLTDVWMPVLSDNTVVATAAANPGKLPTTVPLIVQSPGAGYNQLLLTNTTITGDGTGATVIAAGVVLVGGAVNAVALATGGQGYTQVNTINVFQSGITTSANVRAIIPPYPNHGYDPIKEIRASALLMAVELQQSESGRLTVKNDYRRACLLINPVNANSANLATESFYETTYNLTLTSNTGVFLSDDTVTNITNGSKPVGIVVDVNTDANNVVTVRLTDVNIMGANPAFQAGDTIKNLNSGVEGVVASVQTPQLKFYSGQIIWVNQRTPVNRGPAQSELLKLVFPFV